jgi:phosphate transport system substrate-binding protein
MFRMMLSFYIRWFVKMACGCLCLLAVSGVRADISITGASTIQPVVKRVAEKFSAATGVRVRISGGGSDQGVRDVMAGRTQIGMVSRDLHPDEAGRLVVHPVGLDAIAVFVHERNPLRELARRQVADIFSGNIREWSELAAGGGGRRIVLVGKEHGRSTRELFDRFFGLTGKEYPRGTHMIGADVAGILYVGIDPQAIGYVSAGALGHAAQQGAPVKPLSIAGVLPSTANIRNGSYPYQRPLNLITQAAPRGETKAFIAWMLGPDGRNALREEGFVPFGEAR